MRFLSIALLPVLASVVNADSWMAAEPMAAVSGNSEWLVRIAPVENSFSVRDTLGRALSIDFLNGTTSIVDQSDVCVEGDT